MDNKTLIVNALAVGAAASFRPNVMYLPEDEKQVINAHDELKALIGQKYSDVEATLLDIGPANAERHQLLAEQLQKAGASDDQEVMALVRHLLRVALDEEPEALAAVGLGPTELETHLLYD